MRSNSVNDFPGPVLERRPFFAPLPELTQGTWRYLSRGGACECPGTVVESSERSTTVVGATLSAKPRFYGRHMPEKIKIVLDTDIADDIDDAICLSMALGSPEIEILGITTVYGDVETRTRVARKICRSWGRDDIPIVPGFERPLQFDWYPETNPEECSQEPAVADEKEPIDRSTNASQFIADCVRRYPGEVNICTIGALTNVGAALSMDPSLAPQIAGIYSNAGKLPPAHNTAREWNIMYDPLACQIAAKSGAPWAVLGNDVTSAHLGLGRQALDRLAALGTPASELLAELIVLYRRHKFHDTSVKTVADVESAWVADCNTLFALLYPESFELRTGTITIGDDSTINFREHSEGLHQLAFSSIPREYNDKLVARVLGEKQVRNAP